PKKASKENVELDARVVRVDAGLVQLSGRKLATADRPNRAMRGGFSIENQSVSFPSFALHASWPVPACVGTNIRGDPVDQERTIARAIGASVNYFDTAVR